MITFRTHWASMGEIPVWSKDEGFVGLEGPV